MPIARTLHVYASKDVRIRRFSKRKGVREHKIHSMSAQDKLTVRHYYYYCYYYYLLQLSFHSVAVVLILAQTKQIRIHKRNNTKTKYK
jgi:protein involved in ribonucleotide reduction